MQMTEDEIVISYQQAKNKCKQIGILADLNECSKSQIARIIEARGIPVAKPFGSGVTKPDAKEEEPEETESAAEGMPEIIARAVENYHELLCNRINMLDAEIERDKKAREEIWLELNELTAAARRMEGNLDESSES